MGYVEISQEQLAEAAGLHFAGASIDDIPSKLWMDYWPAGEQHYLRAIFDDDVSEVSLYRLKLVASELAARYGVDSVCVAYSGDWTWEDVEAWVTKLQAVR